MQCPKCGSTANENDAFCKKCGCNLKASQNQVLSSNVTLASKGLCPHCGKPFSPKISDKYKRLNVLSVIMGILFGLFAFLTLLIMLGGSGFAWVFALIFGAAFFVIQKSKNKEKAKIDEEPCPHCGRNKKGELVGTPASEETQDIPVNAEGSVDHPHTAINNEALRNTKMCASCKAHNAMENEVCDDCGFKFGKIVTATDGRNKFGLVTCPGCGSVYQVKKNIPFIVICALIGVLSLSVWLPGFLFIINLVLAGTFISLAVMHAAGQLSGLSIKKCTVCHKTPIGVFWDKLARKQDMKLINRKPSVITNIAASVNKGMTKIFGKFNLLPFGSSLSTIIFVIMMFAKNEVELDSGIYEKTQDLLYLDAVLNFGGPIHFIVLIILPFLFIATNSTNFKSKTRLIGIPAILGAITAFAEIVLAIANTAFTDFEYVQRNIEYDGEYPVGGVNVGIIISAVIMIVTVFAAYLIERERRYIELTSGESKK